jgi:hypothetical protein
LDIFYGELAYAALPPTVNMQEKMGTGVVFQALALDSALCQRRCSQNEESEAKATTNPHKEARIKSDQSSAPWSFRCVSPAVTPKLLEIAGKGAEGLIAASASFDPQSTAPHIREFVDVFGAFFSFPRRTVGMHMGMRLWVETVFH